MKSVSTYVLCMVLVLCLNATLVSVVSMENSL